MNTSRKREFFDQRARNEKLQSPETIQKTKAVRHPNAVRRARVKTVGTTTFTCRLLDSGGDEIATDITVYPIEHLGSNALTGDVWPDYAVNDVLAVFKDLNGTWYTKHPFDDTTECDEE